MIKVLKIFLLLSNGIKKIGRIVSKGFIEIIYVQTTKGQVTYVYLFGKRIFVYDKNKAAKSGLNTVAAGNSGGPVVYFTANKYESYTISCVQRWVDIADALRYDYCFVCDNKDLEYAILRNVVFHSTDIRFISRMKTNESERISKCISSEKWIKPCQAHLTAFYEATQNDVSEFWKVDADDTVLCMPVSEAVKALRAAEKIARDENIAVISMDMWHSRTHGTHWSWGVAFVRNVVSYTEIFSDIKDNSWAGNKYKTGDGSINVDWFFTYLKAEKGLRCETFYIDKSYFIHYGNFLKYPRMVAAIYYYGDNRISYPVYRFVFGDEKNGYIPISDDDIRIDVGLTDKQGIEFLRKYIGLV